MPIKKHTLSWSSPTKKKKLCWVECYFTFYRWYHSFLDRKRSLWGYWLINQGTQVYYGYSSGVETCWNYAINLYHCFNPRWICHLFMSLSENTLWFIETYWNYVTWSGLHVFSRIEKLVTSSDQVTCLNSCCLPPLGGRRPCYQDVCYGLFVQEHACTNTRIQFIHID
jgi:hypothetical protein